MNDINNITGLITFLQACITPVALISGVGLLILTLTNRLGRIIDKVRSIRSELDDSSVKRIDEKKIQISILYQRAKLIRNAIALITCSIISSGLIILVLAITLLGKIDIHVLGYFFFCLSIIFFIISAGYFFYDVLLSLKAIKLEIKEYV